MQSLGANLSHIVIVDNTLTSHRLGHLLVARRDNFTAKTFASGKAGASIAAARNSAAMNSGHPLFENPGKPGHPLFENSRKQWLSTIFSHLNNTTISSSATQSR
jgi:hypothetical protein